MKLSETERLLAIVKLLLANNTYLNVSEVTSVLNISRRNVYYAIDSINQILEKENLGTIYSAYGKGMYLDDKQKNHLNSIFSESDLFDIYSFSADERIACYYCEIFYAKKPLKIDDFGSLFKVSRYTTISDINGLKESLGRFDLSIQYENKGGYHINGKELNRRKAFMSMFSILYSIYIEHPDIFNAFSFLNENVKENYVKLKQIETEEYSYYDCSVLALSVLLCYVRDHGNSLTVSANTLAKDKPDSLKNELQFIRQEFPYLNEIEASYFAYYLAYSRMGINKVALSNSKMRAVAKRMVEIYYLLTAIQITDEEFLDQLSAHIELAYQRYQLGIAVDNPLLEQIKKKYGSYYDIVKQAALPIEEAIGGPIGDNEIGFLTLYFVGQSEKKKKEVPKVRTLVICLNGLSTSYLLKNEIENLDSRIEVIASIGLNEYKRLKNKCDLVVSTIPFTPNTGDRGIVIHPILTFEDKTAIGNVLNKIIFTEDGAPSFTKILDVVKPYIRNDKIGEASANLKTLYENSDKIPVVRINRNDVFRPEFVSIAKKDDEWQLLIRQAALPLIKEGYIKTDYVDEIISSIKKYGSYMVFAHGYLLGHASAEKSRQLGLSYLRLDSWKTIMENEVKGIMILTPTDYTSHLGVVYKLLDIFNSNEIDDRIQKAETSKEIYQIIDDVVFK